MYFNNITEVRKMDDAWGNSVDGGTLVGPSIPQIQYNHSIGW